MTNLEALREREINFWSKASLEEVAFRTLQIDQDQFAATFITSDGQTFCDFYKDSEKTAFRQALDAEKAYLMKPQKC